MASQDIHLYYFPGSFYSQRVLVALAEKKIKYKETCIDLAVYEQLSPWYLRLNPAGEVPLLKVGDKLIPQSETIVEVVDTLKTTEDFKLLPDVSTKEGQLVSNWREKLDAVEVEEITYGVLLNPHISPRGFKGFGRFMTLMISSRDAYNAKISKTIKRLKKMKEENPDLVECIDKILVKQSVRVEGSRYRAEDVEVKLKQLDKTMDEVEEQLKRNNTESWLCGRTFSLADVNLCTLLGRLQLTGLLERYMDPEKRPLLNEYWTRAKKRQSIKVNVLGAIPNCLKITLRKKLSWLATRVIIPGLVVAAAVFVAKIYASS